MPPSFSQAVSMILRQWAADWISPARSTALHPASSDPLASSGLVDRGAVPNLCKNPVREAPLGAPAPRGFSFLKAQLAT